MAAAEMDEDDMSVDDEEEDLDGSEMDSDNDAEGDEESDLESPGEHTKVTVNKKGYGFRVFCGGGRNWPVRFDYRIVDYTVAMAMAARMSEDCSRSGRRTASPPAHVLEALRHDLDKLAIMDKQPLYNVSCTTTKLFLLFDGCAPLGLHRTDDKAVTTVLFAVVKEAITNAGHDFVVVSCRHCGEICKEARKCKKVAQGLCVLMTPQDRQRALVDVILPCLAGDVADDHLKAYSRTELLGPSIEGRRRLLSGDRTIVLIFVGATAASSLTFDLTQRLQEEVPHAATPHFSRCNSEAIADRIDSTFAAFGAPLPPEKMHQEGKRLIHDCLHSTASRDKARATMRTPEYRAKLSAKITEVANERTVDADLLQRMDFSKTKFYAIKCRACDVDLGDRCQWAGHCKTTPHKRAAELYRHPDIKYYQMGRGTMEGEPTRLCLRCMVCLRACKDTKKGTALRPHLFDQHNNSEKHQKAVKLANALRKKDSTAASGSGQSVPSLH